MKVIKVKVEKKEGHYWGITEDCPIVALSNGENMEALKCSMDEAFKESLEVAMELGKKWVSDYDAYRFEYRIDLKEFFELIPEIKISVLAEKANINASLMRQYVSGKAAASEERLRLIQNTIHKLGEELLSVSF